MLGHCLDSAWTRAWTDLACFFKVAQKLGATEGIEKPCWMLLQFLLATFVINTLKEKTHANLIQSGMCFPLNLFITFLPRRTCICLGSWLQHQRATALALLTHGTDQSTVENALLKHKEKLSPV